MKYGAAVRNLPNKKDWHLQQLILTHSIMNVKPTGKDILNERTQGGLCTL
jgi:hypothetical protein